MKKQQLTVPKKVGLPLEDKILNIIVYVTMILVVIVVAYPMIFVLSSSFSSGRAVTNGWVLLWPVEPSIRGYQMVFNYRIIWTGYANTIYITVVATVINVILTTLAAYPLSRRNMQGRKIYMTLFMITMFFSGGMIPNYILRLKLGLIGSRWAVILNGALSVYNMIIMRTFFMNSIPQDLFDAARIDGISDIGYLMKIVIPLSRAVFAVIVLYYAVAHWNSYFSSMLYLRDRDMYPLQMVLRDILSASSVDLDQFDDAEILASVIGSTDLIKYASIVVSAGPVLVAYPFVQKFFEKGVMLGSVKG